MNRISSLVWIFVPVVIFASLLPCACAAEPGKGPQYNVTYDEAGKEKERTFDLSKGADATDLNELLRNGEVSYVEQAKPINILAIAWDLGLWTLVVFLLLYYILRKFAWKPMLEGLQRREHNIRSAIEDAQKAREEAEQLRTQFQSEMNRAAEKVRDIMDAARRDAEQNREDMLAQTRTEIQKERERLRREIEMARDQALQEIWNQTARLATVVSSKAIRRQLTEEDHRRLVEEAMADLGSAVRRGNGATGAVQ